MKDLFQTAYPATLASRAAPAAPNDMLSILCAACQQLEEGLLIFNLNFELLFFNDKANDIINSTYGFHCHKGMYFVNWMPEYRRQSLLTHFNKACSGKKAKYEIEVPQPNRAAIWLECCYFPIAGDGEQPAAIGIFIKDITVIKELEIAEALKAKAEEESHQNRLLFELFMEHSPIMAWINNSQGDMCYMNALHRQFYGFVKEDEGKNLFELYNQETAAYFHTGNLQVLQNGMPQDYTKELKLKNGTMATYKVIKFPIQFNGETMIGSWAVDITEQKELQRKLVQQEKNNKKEVVRSIIETQEKERRKLSIELHDNINQILSSCKLMLEVARENGENAPALTEKAYQSLKAVIIEIRKLSHELNPSTLDDVGLLDAIYEMTDKINASKKLTVRFTHDMANDTDGINQQDKIAVYRIIQEQLSNIIKHAKATEVTIQLSKSGSQLLLQIADNGIGFDSATIKKGLGLKNISNRVEYYHGQLEISHTQGCHMRIVLNMTPPLQ